LIIVLCSLLIGACDDSARKEEQIKRAGQVAVQNMDRLSRGLEQGQIRNALMIRNYARQLRQSKPEMSELITVLEQDATNQGPVFRGLKMRLDDVINKPALYPDWQARYLELQSISEAADPAMYNDALSDPLNVLADMSDGALPRVNAISREAQMQAGSGGRQNVGEQLVGNPQYGQWRAGSNGMSFWEWYGMYALFSNFFPSRPYYYGDWAGRRGYSYYSDVGRGRYTSPRQRTSQARVYSKTADRFQRQRKPFTSPYAKTRTGASGLSSASRKAARQPVVSRYSNNKFGSSSSKTKSSYGSSFRSGFGSRSRGLSFGK